MWSSREIPGTSSQSEDSRAELNLRLLDGIRGPDIQFSVFYSMYLSDRKSVV